MKSKLLLALNFILHTPYGYSQQSSIEFKSKVHAEQAITDANRHKSRIEWGTLRQKLDHFNATDLRYWTQHYLHRKSPSSQSKNGTVFLIIGGETPVAKSWLANEGLPHIQMARKINASIYMLEHRFYGQSRPTPDLSLESLQYLNARQAVQDVTMFVEHINNKENYENPKWVTIGGSYSGNLAAWSRFKAPKQIRAAIASSAPILAVLNFKEFEILSRKIIAKTDAECANRLQHFFQLMREHMKTLEGRRELVKIFRLDNSLIQDHFMQNDAYNFFHVVSNYVSYILMYSKINVRNHRDTLNLQAFCKHLSMNEKSMSALRSIISAIMKTTGKPERSHIDISYESFVKFMKNESWNDENNRYRAWLFQSCNEFGQFRTSENSDHLFAGMIPLHFFTDRCQNVFGNVFTEERIRKSVHNTNKYFGGNVDFEGDSVIFTNGSDDPWSFLGVRHSPRNASIDILLISGTSHAAEFYPPRKTDSQSLRNAQLKIYQLIEKYTSS